MVKLLQVLTALIVLNLCCLYGYDQDSCPLKVEVFDNQGRAVMSLVKVVESSGRIHEYETDKGSAVFCDLGIEPVRVEVGNTRSCYQSITRNVALFENETVLLKIFHDTSRCNKTSMVPPSLSCHIAMRFRDEDDKPLGKVNVVVSGAGPMISSSYGRIYFNLVHFQAIVGKVEDSRYESTPFRYTCRPGELQKDIVIFLKANGPA
jgi:hypothetical protein